jgi:hypothetical protein
MVRLGLDHGQELPLCQTLKHQTILSELLRDTLQEQLVCELKHASFGRRDHVVEHVFVFP